MEKEVARRSQCQTELTKANEQLTLLGTTEKQLQKVSAYLLAVEGFGSRILRLLISQPPFSSLSPTDASKEVLNVNMAAFMLWF